MINYIKDASIAISKKFIYDFFPTEEIVFELISEEFQRNELKKLNKLHEKKLAFIEGAGELVFSAILIPLVFALLTDYMKILLEKGVKNLSHFFDNDSKIENTKNKLKKILRENYKNLNIEPNLLKNYEENIILTIIENQNLLQDLLETIKKENEKNK